MEALLPDSLSYDEIVERLQSSPETWADALTRAATVLRDQFPRVTAEFQERLSDGDYAKFVAALVVLATGDLLRSAFDERLPFPPL